MRRKLMVFVAVVAAILATAGCDPSDPRQMQAWYDLNPEQGEEVTAETMNEPQAKVVMALADRQAQETQFYLGIQRAQELAFYEGIVRSQRSTDCHGAIRQVWPASMWSWADGIVRRESGNTPTARNSQSVGGSYASGCWQLLLPMHSGRFTAAGCSAAQWTDALCNTRAAYQLYLAAGTSPWRL